MLRSSRKTLAVLGIPFHDLTMEETVALLEEHIREGGFHQVATANVDFLKNALRDERLRSTLCSCDVVIPRWDAGGVDVEADRRAT